MPNSLNDAPNSLKETSTSLNYLLQDWPSPSVFRRFAAMGYDTLLLMAISILYGAVMLGINVFINGSPEPGHRATWGNWNMLVSAGWFITLIYFFCFFWHKSGQTLGMKTWHIKVISTTDNQYPNYLQCMIRCLLAPLSFLCLGAGYWYMYLNPERQSLHDKLSKTRLVMTKEAKNK